MQCQYVRSAQAILHRNIGKLYNRNIRNAFVKWTKYNTAVSAIKFSETDGIVALENTDLKKTLEIYHNFIKEEGHDPKHLEIYLIENQSLEEILMRRNLQGRYRNDTNDLLETTFMT